MQDCIALLNAVFLTLWSFSCIGFYLCDHVCVFVRCVCVWEQKVTALVVAHGNTTNREVSHPSGHRETTQLHFLFLLRKHIFNVALKVCRGLRYLGEGWWWWGGDWG